MLARVLAVLLVLLGLVVAMASFTPELLVGVAATLQRVLDWLRDVGGGGTA